MMGKDYSVWNIDELALAYTNVPDLADTVRAAMEALFKFMETEGLLTCRVTNEQGQVVKRQIMASQITDEGNRLSSGPKNPVHRWLGSKGAQKNPPDIRMLEKALAEIRAGR
jgi:hypothetical protein